MPKGQYVRIADKSLVCRDCGATFLAKRRDAKRCLDCQEKARRESANRPRPHRYNEPGVGRGKYLRTKSDRPCPRCGARHMAFRSDTPCVECHAAARKDTYKRSDRRPERLGTCSQCGNPTGRNTSRLCAACWAARGANNPTWKGGRVISKAGYYWVRVDGKYQQEHRYVWEQAHGPLPEGSVVHHLNGNKLDNRLENLAAMPRHRHHKEPREALRPYEAQIREREARIRELEAEVERLRK